MARDRSNKKDNKSLLSRNKEITSLMNLIDQGMSELYKDTYFSSDQPKRSLDTLSTEIDSDINSIIAKRRNGFDTSSISRLIAKTKLQDSKTEKELMDGLSSLFGDERLMNQLSTYYQENNAIKDYDNQIDLICKYYSKLEDTVDTKIDNILSADHFTKNFLSVHGDGVNQSNQVEVMSNVKELRRIHDFDKRAEQWLRNIIKYGEQFIYVVPYKRALARLMNMTHVTESVTLSTITECTTDNQDIIEVINPEEIRVSFHYNGFVEDVVEEEIHIEETLQKNVKSLNEDFNITTDTTVRTVDKIHDKTITNGDKFIYPGQDGLVDTKQEDLKIKGAIVREFDREKVKPIYIDNTCMGYYYVDVQTTESTKIRNSIFTPNVIGRPRGFDTNELTAEDQFISNLAGDIVSHIDAKFINANSDLKEEIYLMLKYNASHSRSIKSVDVTFIPPEDMIHMYFEMDSKTHRGVSELSRSIIPATLLIGLYLSNTTAIMTRGQDKRVYYVKQNLEKNVAKTMINVTNQIKKNNFNFRSLNTIYNVLDIVGKFNDFIIPTSQGGEAPIQFEIMPGQNISINEDLYNMLEEQALNPTGVSRELIDARNSLDYAIQATMANSKFLRKMLKKQGLFTPYLSRTLTMIYNYEYETKENIEVTLPAPQILNLNNVNQIINACNEYTNTIVETEMSNDTDQAKAKFKAKMTRYVLSSHMPYDVIDKFVEDARLEAAVETASEE